MPAPGRWVVGGQDGQQVGIWTEKISFRSGPQHQVTENGADFSVVCRPSAAASFHRLFGRDVLAELVTGDDDEQAPTSSNRGADSGRGPEWRAVDAGPGTSRHTAMPRTNAPPYMNAPPITCGKPQERFGFGQDGADIGGARRAGGIERW